VLRALEKMARQGTTTVEAKSGYGLSVESELKSLRAIKIASESWQGTVVATLLGAHVVPPEYRDRPEAYVDLVCEQMIPAVAEQKLATYVDVFCERGAFSPDQSAKILRVAVERGLKTRVHVCQLTQAELAPLLEFHPASLDHMDYVSDGDLPALAKSPTMATLLPAANYFLGLERFPPARRLIDAGAAVAIATDYNPGTAPTPSMPLVLSLACTHMKMSPAEAITAATINGSCALELQHRKGSLEPGKDADIAIFDAQDYRELAYWFGVNRCEQVFLRGQLA
jgi:imidazolonepropionase